MERVVDGFVISDELGRIQFPRVHAWLTGTYWSPGIVYDRVLKAANGSSLVVGVFDGDEQVAYCRVVSDLVRFAWLCDVYVEPAYRGRGISKAMMSFVMEHPDHLDIDRWMLGTLDAHGLYEQYGFAVHPHPDRIMVRQIAPWPTKS